MAIQETINTPQSGGFSYLLLMGNGGEGSWASEPHKILARIGAYKRNEQEVLYKINKESERNKVVVYWGFL